jgi:alkylation response protein AidB-like acyl-CoA dehydrogenase
MTTATIRLDAARELQPLIRAHADSAEQDRRLPPALVRTLADAGLFRLWLPAEIGGDALDPASTLPVIEMLAQADASVAWCVMVAAQCAAWLPYLEQDLVKNTFGPDDILAGTLSPMCARPVAGGYCVSGRASFASGCRHATWIFGNGVVTDGDAPRLKADGTPERRWLFFRAADCTIIDTWHTLGMRGTGSEDYAVTDLFVPDTLASSPLPIDRGSVWGGPLYQASFLWTMRAALALGIARHALDTLVELASTRKPLRSQVVLRDMPQAQAAVGRAEAAVAAARAFLYSAVATIWERIIQGQPLADRDRVLMPQATVHTVTTCAEVVESMYRLGGGAAIYTTSPLERCFRDVNTLMADQSAAMWVPEAAGRVYLGHPLPDGTF